MSAAVVGDEVEVVRKWSGEHLAVAKLVALGLSVELDEVDKRLEDHQEDGWAVGIPLKDALEELEELAHPVLGCYFAVELAVKRFDVVPLFFRDVVVLEAKLDQLVADTPKGVGEVKPGDVDGPSVCLGVLDDFLEHLDVLHAPIDSCDEGLLVAGVDVAVPHHKVVHPRGLDLVVGLAKAAGEGQGPEVGWFVGISSLVAELHQASCPGFWGKAGGVCLVVVSGQEVMDRWEFGAVDVDSLCLPCSLIFIFYFK